MNDTIENKLKQARIKLFKSNEGLIYFGILSYKFNIIIEDFGNETSDGYVLINDKENNENKIFINERFLIKDDYNSDHLIYVIIHEILHILEKHSLRLKNRIFKYWAVAADHCINRELNKIKNISSYYEGVNLPFITDENLCAEQVYELLINNNNIQISDIMSDDNTQINGFKVTDSESGKSWNISNKIGGINNENDLNEINLPDSCIKNKTEEIKTQATVILDVLKNDSNKSRGLQSGNFYKYINELLKVEIDWSIILEKAIKRNIIKKTKKRKWTTPNKIFQSLNIVLPGKTKSTGPDEDFGTLYIAIDSSGSIENSWLQQFTYIIQESFDYFNLIKIFTHDVQINDEKDFKQKDKLLFINELNKIKFKKGGTSHEYLFDKIEEYWNTIPNIKNMLSMVILLTDGISDIENIYTNYSWIKNNIPIMILIPNNSNFDFNFKIGNFNIIKFN